MSLTGIRLNPHRPGRPSLRSARRRVWRTCAPSGTSCEVPTVADDRVELIHLRPLVDVVAETSTLLATVEDEVRWAHAIGYGKAGRGIGAGRGSVNPTLIDERDSDQ